MIAHQFRNRNWTPLPNWQPINIFFFLGLKDANLKKKIISILSISGPIHPSSTPHNLFCKCTYISVKVIMMIQLLNRFFFFFCMIFFWNEELFLYTDIQFSDDKYLTIFLNRRRSCHLSSGSHSSLISWTSVEVYPWFPL